MRTGPSEEMTGVVMNLGFRMTDVLVCAVVYYLSDGRLSTPFLRLVFTALAWANPCMNPQL